MAMNGNEGGSAYPPNPDVKSGSCLIAGFQPLTVVHPSYWNAYKTESGATFSIDMVRLKLSFINGKGEWLSTHAQTFDCDSMSAWTSKIRPGGWYELWSFDLGDSSVALGIGFMEPSCKANLFLACHPVELLGDAHCFLELLVVGHVSPPVVWYFVTIISVRITEMWYYRIVIRTIGAP